MIWLYAGLVAKVAREAWDWAKFGVSLLKPGGFPE